MCTPAIHIHQRVVAAFVDAVDGKARGAQVVCQHIADDIVARQDTGGRCAPVAPGAVVAAAA